MSKKKKRQRAQELAQEESPSVPVDWAQLPSFSAASARVWSEKNVDKIIAVATRTFKFKGIYKEGNKLYFWVEPHDSERSWFRIDSKIGKLLKNNLWIEVK